MIRCPKSTIRCRLSSSQLSQSSRILGVAGHTSIRGFPALCHFVQVSRILPNPYDSLEVHSFAGLGSGARTPYGLSTIRTVPIPRDDFIISSIGKPPCLRRKRADTPSARVLVGGRLSDCHRGTSREITSNAHLWKTSQMP